MSAYGLKDHDYGEPTLEAGLSAQYPDKIWSEFIGVLVLQLVFLGLVLWFGN